MGCHSLLQGIFPIQESHPVSPAWQADSLPLSHLGSPSTHNRLSKINKKKIKNCFFELFSHIVEGTDMEPSLGCLGPQTPIPHLFSSLHSPSVPSHLFFILSLFPNYAYWSHFLRSSAPKRMDPEHLIILGLHPNNHEDQWYLPYQL